jgi:hypothetical protein
MSEKGERRHWPKPASLTPSAMPSCSYQRSSMLERRRPVM